MGGNILNEHIFKDALASSFFVFSLETKYSKSSFNIIVSLLEIDLNKNDI